MVVGDVFRRCVEAVSRGELIKRESAKDKEFHFQNWFRDRLASTGLPFEDGGRNSYPDFRLVRHTDGFEVKGLAYPGRTANFDSNSQVPAGFHNGRTIYYVFGRYPKKPDGDLYPLLDLTICHGDFLNADREYVHKNKSIRCFGTYGDIMIRDRKMYVVPTPFSLADGLAHHFTLVLPDGENPGEGFHDVGVVRRREADHLVVGYSFDLVSNALQITSIPNGFAGKEHVFRAWRVQGSAMTTVGEAARTAPIDEDEDEDDDA